MTAVSARLQPGSIFACFAAAGSYWGTFVATLPAFEERSALTPADFGLALMAQAVGGILAMQGLGRILHRVQAVAVPVFRSVASRHLEATRGRALALATGIADIGYLAAPPVLGRLIDGAGWPAMFVTLAAVALAAAAVARLVPPARLP